MNLPFGWLQFLRKRETRPAESRKSLRRIPFWSWLWFILGGLYFILPLYATMDFSLRMERDKIGFKAYTSAFADPGFLHSFGYSIGLAAITIVASILLIVPTAYWIRLRLPEARIEQMNRPPLR